MESPQSKEASGAGRHQRGDKNGNRIRYTGTQWHRICYGESCCKYAKVNGFCIACSGTAKVKIKANPSPGDRRIYKGIKQVYSPPAWKPECEIYVCDIGVSKFKRCYKHLYDSAFPKTTVEGCTGGVYKE